MHRKLVVVTILFSIFISSCFSQSAEIDFESIDNDISSFVNSYQGLIVRTDEFSIPMTYAPEGGLIFMEYDKDQNLLSLDSYLFFETGKINYKNYFLGEGINYFVKTTMIYDKPFYYDDFQIVSTFSEYELFINGKVYLKDSESKIYSLSDDLSNMNLLKELLDLTM